MECQQFQEKLQSFLDGNLKSVPTAAERHQQSCERCRVLYSQLFELRGAVQKIPKPNLSSRTIVLMTGRIAQSISRSKEPFQLLSLWHNLLENLAAIRWGHVLLTGSTVVAGLFLIVQLFTVNNPEPTRLQAGNDIDFLLEEHAIAMESGIFQGSSQYANLTTSTEPEQR